MRRDKNQWGYTSIPHMRSWTVEEKLDLTFIFTFTFTSAVCLLLGILRKIEKKIDY